MFKIPKRKLPWSDEEIEAVLNIIKKEVILEKLGEKECRGKDIYEFVEKKLLENYGFERDAQQIMMEVKNLRRQYMEATKYDLSSRHIPHFELLDEVFGSKPIVINKEARVESENVDKFEEILNEISSNLFNDHDNNKFEEEVTETVNKKRRLNEEEELIEKHHRWLTEEFRKQREFERRENELCRKEFRKLIEILMKPGTSEMRNNGENDTKIDLGTYFASFN